MIRLLTLFHRSPSVSTCASELGKRGAEIRRQTERERFLATTRQLLREMGKPIPEVFQ